MQKAVTAEDYLQQSVPFDPEIEVEQIEVVPKLVTKEMELDLFMREMVTINIAQSTDANATPHVEVSVNGRRKIIPRGVNFPVERMYVERLARAKRVMYTQDLNQPLDEYNRLQKHRGLDYPFQMTEDKNPLGAEWLKRVLLEP